MEDRDRPSLSATIKAPGTERLVRSAPPKSLHRARSPPVTYSLDYTSRLPPQIGPVTIVSLSFQWTARPTKAGPAFTYIKSSHHPLAPKVTTHHSQPRRAMPPTHLHWRHGHPCPDQIVCTTTRALDRSCTIIVVGCSNIVASKSPARVEPTPFVYKLRVGGRLLLTEGATRGATLLNTTATDLRSFVGVPGSGAPCNTGKLCRGSYFTRH